jgi:uncharacterized protein (DUF1810 family)
MIERFVLAQDRAFFEGILAELQAGRKSSHWMWFVFPQLKGMGTSYNAKYYPRLVNSLEFSNGGH